MLTKWFGTRALRSPKKDLSFRPWLESLEDRNAPSGLGPMDDNGHGNGNDNGNGNGHGPHGPPPPPPAPVAVSNGNSSNVNAHGSFNGSTITNSFNDTINNSTIVLMPSQQFALQGLLGLSGLLATTLNSPQLGSLLNDEIALAVDTYLTSPAISGILPASVVSSLKSDEATLSAAIHSNPLESNPIGAALGTLAFEVTLNTLASAQATI